HLARSSIAWKRSVGRSPDLASTPGTHVTKRPTRGPVPISGPSTPPGPGATTPRIMEETGARSHTGPGDRGPGSGPTKKVTGAFGADGVLVLASAGVGDGDLDFVDVVHEFGAAGRDVGEVRQRGDGGR